MLLTHLCFYNYIYAIIHKQNKKKEANEMRSPLSLYLYLYYSASLANSSS